MAFPRRFLDEGEEVVLDRRPHWRCFALPAVALAAAIGLSVGLAADDAHDLAQVAAAGVVLVALGWFVVRYLRWATTHFVVTNNRLIYRAGILSRHGIEMPLERVDTVTSRQGLLQRLLRTGDVVVESAGEHGQQRFADVPRPSRVRAEIYRQIEAGDERGRPQARRHTSAIDQLERLAELHRRGVITLAELEAKKTQLLDRM